ncbi:O-antigen ligase family protein [Paracoccus benzoatiresistens]|uniref:O-antigen ligase family protein n=1 Tax=Paracoccus benzoatiresistens TaxID=2997341 RepID=A0ABT4J0I5_9RHOB|nr:O-antigen ligase family protein [Paracoccus sp. EF6]MCZ0960631.1 O-antigen ligase family protein [Paracoccus sp. EF6]
MAVAPISATRPGTGWVRDAEFLCAVLVVFLSPMNHFRLDAIYFTASDAAALACLFLLTIQGRIPTRPFGEATPIWLAGYALLITGLIMGSVAAAAVWEAVTVVGQYTFSLFILPLVVGGRSREQCLVMVKALIMSVCLVMLFGFYVVHVTGPDPAYDFISISGRMRSLVERENELAALGAITATLACGMYLLQRLALLPLLLALGILGYGILLTGSNTGLGCTALGLLVLLVFSGSPRLISIFALILMACTAVLMIKGTAMLPPIFQERVLGALTSGDLNAAGTFTDRLQLVKEAFAIARDTPLIGLGAEQFRTVSVFQAPVHNTYLLLLCEGGVLSLLGLVLLLIAGLYLSLFCLASSQTRIVGTLILAVLLIYFMMLNTFPHFYGRFWNVPLILLMTLGAACLPGAAPSLHKSPT